MTTSFAQSILSMPSQAFNKFPEIKGKNSIQTVKTERICAIIIKSIGILLIISSAAHIYLVIGFSGLFKNKYGIITKVIDFASLIIGHDLVVMAENRYCHNLSLIRNPTFKPLSTFFNVGLSSIIKASNNLRELDHKLLPREFYKTRISTVIKGTIISNFSGPDNRILRIFLCVLI